MKEIFKTKGVKVKGTLKIPGMGRIRINIKDPEYTGEYDERLLDAGIELIDKFLKFIQENELV